jgi:dolichol kinase
MRPILSQILAIGSSERLHLRNDLHLARKIWHLGMGVMIVCIYGSGLSASNSVLLLAAFLCFSIFVELSRLRVPALNEKVIRFWGPVMRSCEVDRISGIPYYILAALLAIGIFPKPVAILSILYLACGDPIASLFGIQYGDQSIRFSNGKSLIGTMAGIVTCFMVGLFYLESLGFHGLTLILVASIGAIAGGTAELLPFETDDNFTIPIVSGFTLWLLFIVLGL